MIRERIPGLLLLACGLAVGLEAATFEVRFLTDPVGPKALPFLVAVVLVVAGAQAAARPLRDVPWPEAAVLGKLSAAAGAFLLYAAALPLLGFFASTTLVVAALSSLFGAPRRRGLVSASLLAGALWILFVNLLALPLPVGSLWMR